MKRWVELHKILLCLFLILFAPINLDLSLGAEFYRWTDKDGVTHISNHPQDNTVLKENGLEVLKIYENPSEASTVNPLPKSLGAEGYYVVPFKKQNGGMLVDVIINDYINAKMLLDTGASTTSINVGLLNKLNQSLPARPITGKAATAGGMVDVKGIFIETINLGGAVKKNVLATYSDEKYDFAYCDGLLGMSFLSDFKFTIDYVNNTITLHEP